MSDEQEQPNPHEDEQQDVAAQAGAINMISRASELVGGFFGGNVRVYGKTDFEGHALNAMIDMVESANPEHLETAGKALWDAHDAIKAAAEELEGHVGRVDWEGESGTAFREWGGKLVKHALALSSFAEAAGTQISAAATGLASTRVSMPPRDNRIDPKTVDEIPTSKQVEDNKEYAAAVKAEKDRQEAINQMNRLASYYAVSEEVLAAQEPPTFEAMPDVGVPKPDPSWGRYRAGEGQGSGSLGDTHSVVSTTHDSSGGATSHSLSVDTTPPLKQVDESTVYPNSDVGTKIDSVGTLPNQDTARPVTGSPPSVNGTGGVSGGTTPPFAPGVAPPAFGGATGRTSGFGGATGNRAPISAQGRAGTPGGTAGARGSAGPMGRAAATGQTGVRGGGTAADRQLMGRGVSGGTPRPMGGTTNGRAGGIGSTGAARGNGVVGGRPTTGTTSGSTGARVPRGTVVGAEGNNTGSRTNAGRIGQRGVIGAPNANPRPGQTARPIAGNADGVVGSPTGRTPAGRNGAGSGAGTPQGPTGNRRSTNREGREDERQHETQRRNVPPATD